MNVKYSQTCYLSKNYIVITSFSIQHIDQVLQDRCSRVELLHLLTFLLDADERICSGKKLYFVLT